LRSPTQHYPLKEKHVTKMIWRSRGCSCNWISRMGFFDSTVQTCQYADKQKLKMWCTLHRTKDPLTRPELPPLEQHPDLTDKQVDLGERSMEWQHEERHVIIQPLKNKISRRVTKCRLAKTWIRLSPDLIQSWQMTCSVALDRYLCMRTIF